ncbi:MAG: hypothetical protein RRB13_07510 [bacterium]|nr:hypothetical protein [bacterium]
MFELFLDVDGVILDFEATFMDYIRDTLLPDLPLGYRPTSWELEDDALSSLDIQVTWDAFMASGRFNRLQLLADQNSFNQLSARFPVHFVTNLPQEQYAPRFDNLQHHGLNFVSLNMGGHYSFGIENYPSKAQVIEQIRDQNRQVVFLDDHPQNCRDVKTAFPQAQVYLMQRPHNQSLPDEDWERVLDWAEFVARLT